MLVAYNSCHTYKPILTGDDRFNNHYEMTLLNSVKYMKDLTQISLKQQVEMTLIWFNKQ